MTATTVALLWYDQRVTFRAVGPRQRARARASLNPTMSPRLAAPARRMKGRHHPVGWACRGSVSASRAALHMATGQPSRVARRQTIGGYLQTVKHRASRTLLSRGRPGERPTPRGRLKRPSGPVSSRRVPVTHADVRCMPLHEGRALLRAGASRARSSAGREDLGHGSCPAARQPTEHIGAKTGNQAHGTDLGSSRKAADDLPPHPPRQGLRRSRRAGDGTARTVRHLDLGEPGRARRGTGSRPGPAHGTLRTASGGVMGSPETVRDLAAVLVEGITSAMVWHGRTPWPTLIAELPARGQRQLAPLVRRGFTAAVDLHQAPARRWAGPYGCSRAPQPSPAHSSRAQAARSRTRTRFRCRRASSRRSGAWGRPCCTWVR